MKQPFCAPSEALRRVLDAAAALPRPETEIVPLDEADGRIAAGTLSARMDQPPFDRSPFDGYALHSAALRSLPLLQWRQSMESPCVDGRSSFFQIAAFLLREGGGVSPSTLECRLI